jgi:phosphatidylglycerol:prolipoprotein diacylglycerol transferase
MLLAMLYAFRNAVDYGIDSDRLVDVVAIGTVMAIVCARIYYVAMAPFAYQSIWEMIDIRKGGIAIYGAVLGAFIFGGLAAKWRKVPLLPLFDLVSLGFLIGQGIGRWGNFFNREAFGDYTNSLFAMAIPTDYYVGKGTLTGMINSGIITSEMANHMQVYDGMQWITVHPTFLYESVWNLILLIVIFIYRKHKKFDGEIFLMYLWGYGLGRVWIEGLRSDSLMLPFFNMKVSQMIAAICVLACSVLIVKKRMDTVKKQAPAGKKEQ